MIVNNWT